MMILLRCITLSMLLNAEAADEPALRIQFNRIAALMETLPGDRTAAAAKLAKIAEEWEGFVKQYPAASHPKAEEPPLALYNLAACRQRLGQYGAAAEAAEASLQAMKGDAPQRNAARFLAGLARLEQGRAAPTDRAPLEKAAAALGALAGENRPEFAEAGVRAAEALELLNDPAGAAAMAASWVKTHADHPMAGYGAYIVARAHHRADKPADAVAAADAALKQSTLQPAMKADVLLIRGLSHKALKHEAEALADLDAAATAGHPNASAIDYQRGLWLEQAGNHDEATTAYRRSASVAGAPGTSALLRAGVIAFDKNDDKTAIALFEAALKRQPEPAVARDLTLRLAYSRDRAGDHAGALAVARALADDPQAEPARTIAALRVAVKAAVQLKDGPAVVAAAQKLAGLLQGEERFTALVGAADALDDAGRGADALPLYRQVTAAATRSPSVARAWLGIGRLVKDTAPAEARLAFGKARAVALATEAEAMAGYLLAEMLVADEKLEDACDELVQTAGAYAMHPKIAARCLARAATLYEATGRPDLARRMERKREQDFPEKSPPTPKDTAK